jgi:hypothetical protein
VTRPAMAATRMAGKRIRVLSSPTPGVAEISMASDPSTRYRVKLHLRSGWLLIQRMESK